MTHPLITETAGKLYLRVKERREKRKAELKHELEVELNMLELMMYLRSRWYDERDYECFQEYIDAVRSRCDGTGWQVIRMMQVPFKAWFTKDGYEFSVHVTNNTCEITEVLNGYSIS